MERRGDGDLSALWRQATAGRPYLQYQLIGSEVGGHEILLRFILVPVERGGNRIGLIGLDPYTGELGWRLDHVPPAAEWPEPPGSEQLSTVLARSGGALNAFHAREPKLVHANGTNYWYLPASDREIADGLFLPVGREEQPERPADRFLAQEEASWPGTTDHPGGSGRRQNVDRQPTPAGSPRAPPWLAPVIPPQPAHPRSADGPPP